MGTAGSPEEQTTSEPVESATLSSRIARYDQYFDLRTFSDALRKTSKNNDSKKLDSRKPVLVVKRVINYKGQYDHTNVGIKSEALCRVLMDLNPEVEGLRLARSPPEADPQLFFHSHSGLKKRLAEERSKEPSDSSLIGDLEVALQFVEEDHGGNIADLARLTAHQEITYDLLWALIPPNALIYRYHHLTEQDQILLARSIDYKQRQDRTYFAQVACDVISDDGRQGNSFGLARELLEIDQFPGSRRIGDLPLYPLDYHKDKSVVRAHAIERGKRFARMTEKHFEISGPAMRETINDQYKIKRFKFSTNGRVMIDPSAFRVFEPNVTFNLNVYRRLERENLSDEQYMICTPIVLGFCFGVKMWGGFAIDRLHEITWSDEAFRSLVLDPEQKELIHALIKQHTERGRQFDDFVVGKGKGLIGLLCGNPGCGKTLTAEASAEVTRRPLYVVSAGELGTKPEDVDKRLTRILELAQGWNAILLLDEAEVFLQARNTTDLERNAIVSIFLRQLEYYQGILILTTNMIDQCDAAFESRLHFCIQYPDLDKASRRKIWETFFKKALKDDSASISEADLDKLSDFEINGRQIKNAISSAQSIAIERNSQLSVAHVLTVMKAMSNWRKGRKHGS